MNAITQEENNEKRRVNGRSPRKIYTQQCPGERETKEGDRDGTAKEDYTRLSTKWSREEYTSRDGQVG
mgnify:CR=1 FL=1